MFEFSSNYVDKSKQNTVIKKKISLENNLDCFLVIDSKSKNYADTLLNNILDAIIDKISVNNSYGDFSSALENINAFIQTWNTDKSENQHANVIIGILNENNFIFSNIGTAAAYLVNKHKEVITLTDISENKQEFGYISSGELKNDEIISLSNYNILQHLSESDIIDGIDNKADIKHFATNIEKILETEILSSNTGMLHFQYISQYVQEEYKNKYGEFLHDKYLQILDTNFSKKIITLGYTAKDFFATQSKAVKNGVFIVGIGVCIFFLYSTMNNVIGVATNDAKKVVHSEKLEEARQLIRQASQNIANPLAFEKAIADAQGIIGDIQKEKMYLGDIEKMENSINILKKNFNKIETFETNTENQIYAGNFENYVTIVKNNLKPYIIEKKSITGPINTGNTPKKYTNTQLDSDEYFIDAAVIGSDIYLSTSKSKIVRFAKNGYFSFVDVNGQDKWNEHKQIESYGTNIYLVDKNKAQIYRHALSGRNFKKADEYLKADDVTAIGNIQSIAIDGGFYILKDDLMIQKFFASPKYEMTNIVINKLPKNYLLEDNSNKVEIKTSLKLNYVYMFLNNKVFVFQPNSKNYKDVTSLTYIGQIEGSGNEIKDFYVNHDGELWVVNQSGIYDLSFEISDDKLILR